MKVSLGCLLKLKMFSNLQQMAAIMLIFDPRVLLSPNVPGLIPQLHLDFHCGDSATSQNNYPAVERSSQLKTDGCLTGEYVHYLSSTYTLKP